MLESNFGSGTQESEIRERAEFVARYDDVDAALAAGGIEMPIETSLSEALVIGLLKQGVTHYFAIFGHGSTDLGNVLRIYSEAGVVRKSVV